MSDQLMGAHSAEENQRRLNLKRSADAWVTHAQKFDDARRVLLHETAIAAVAFLACVLAAAVISEAVRPPFPAAVPMMDWPPGSI
jgi:hypothetical protein